MGERTQLISDVEQAAALLRANQLVAFATETVYGLGANALSEQAVAGIFEAKQRPHFDPLIVHLAEIEQLSEYVTAVPRAARALSERFWPGPLTLVLPKRKIIPDLVTSGLPQVAMRVPQLPQARELIRLAGVPIAAPSANRFGCVSPTTAQHVLDGLDGRIAAVLDGGNCAVGVESTVIRCDDDGTSTVLRPGGLPIEEIEAVIGPVNRSGSTSQPAGTPQVSPGMLDRHYAPRIPLRIVSDLTSVANSDRSALLCFGDVATAGFPCVINLSPAGSLIEATANFFAALRQLEREEITQIVAVKFPEEGLGIALNDRLQRAAVAE